MNARTTIVVCYKAGTQDILRVCLASIGEYTKEPFCIHVVTADEKSYEEACSERDCGLDVCKYMTPYRVSIKEVPKSRIHGAMLDEYFGKNLIETEFVMTMDSDCFPIAEDWLKELTGMMDNGSKVVGILHPWQPPASDMKKSKLEWRVRSQHCWDSTHVACQMIRTKDLYDLNVTYAGGDDTGLLIPLEAHKRGWKVDGFKVTRCALPRDGSDPEFNRYVCLVFGDKMYHHGGFTRVSVGGDKQVLEEGYGWLKDEIINSYGAAFLLRDDMSYKFKFDREEEVAADKMDRLFGKKTMNLTK